MAGRRIHSTDTRLSIGTAEPRTAERVPSGGMDWRVGRWGRRRQRWTSEDETLEEVPAVEEDEDEDDDDDDDEDDDEDDDDDESAEEPET